MEPIGWYVGRLLVVWLSKHCAYLDRGMGRHDSCSFEGHVDVSLHSIPLEQNDAPGQPATLVDNAYHVLIGADDAVLDGFTVTAGAADGEEQPDDRGGGMYNVDASPTITNVTFSDNTASNYGGAIYNAGGSAPTLVNVFFSSNTLPFAGVPWKTVVAAEVH